MNAVENEVELRMEIEHLKYVLNHKNKQIKDLRFIIKTMDENFKLLQDEVNSKQKPRYAKKDNIIHSIFK